MTRPFKKILCGVLSVFLLGGSSSMQVSAYNVGDSIGKVLSTDIVTFVDGIQVPSYNINGRTAVVTQDLAKLGGKLNFGVYFDEESRSLTINDTDAYGWGASTSLIYEAPTSKNPIGTPVGDVLYTDITTNFNGTPIESFNINGYTCVYADDLGRLCGAYLWDETARRVDVYRNGAHIPNALKTPSGRNFDADEQVITKSETVHRWGETLTSHVVKNSDGTYTTIDVTENINLETYNSDFSHRGSFAIAKELPLFGAFYAGNEYNYIAFGQENLLEDNSREVIRIVVYDKNFSKLRQISVSNCKTAIPFDASGCEMYENGDYLILHTARSQYLDEQGMRPQTQLTVIIDKRTWKITNMLGKFQYNHTSHALQEFVRTDGDIIVTANYSDAAPIRGAFIQELDFYGKVLHTQGIFNAEGALGANCTGAMIGGLEVSDKGYLVTVSSIYQTLPTEFTNTTIEGIDKENRDVYVLYADKNTRELRHTCLASYAWSGYTASVPYIVKLDDNKFMVLWQRFADSEEESNTVCYAFVDGEGKQIGTSYTVTAQLSESCKPILSDGRVIWYVNTATSREFYSLNASVPDINPLPKVETPLPEEPAPEEETDNVSDSDDAVEIEKPNKDIITEVDGI